jgi:hypothetical protein
MAKKVTVTNLNKVYRSLGVKADNFVREVKDQLLISATNIENDATRDKPYDGMYITRESTDNGLTQSVKAGFFGNDKLAAYAEFGTGSYAAATTSSYPPFIRNLAMQYYINGQGRLPAKPYLIPTYLSNRKKFLENVRKIVKKYSA